MKRFITRLSIACVIMVPLAFLPMAISLWISERNLQHAFDLAPHEEVLFLGDSVTGCSIAEYPNDDYRVLWRGSTPQIFALVMLKELERQGKLQHIKICATGIAYHSGHLFTIPKLQRENLFLFGLTWRYSDIFPLEVFYSMEYLAARRYCLVENPFSIPPSHGIPIHEQPQFRKDEILIDSKNFEDVDRENMDRLTSVLMEIQTLCQRNGIKFVVFLTPRLSWSEEYIPLTVKESYIQLTDRLQSKGIYVFDCRNVIEDKYFRDGIHLLPEGARLFTPYFLDLLAPLR